MNRLLSRDTGSIDQNLSTESATTLSLLATDALLCLRLVIKHNENQEQINLRLVKDLSGDRVNIFQHLWGQLEYTIIDKLDFLFGDDFLFQAQSAAESQLQRFTIEREFQIFTDCGSNLNLSTGYDCLALLLKNYGV